MAVTVSSKTCEEGVSWLLQCSDLQRELSALQQSSYSISNQVQFSLKQDGQLDHTSDRMLVQACPRLCSFCAPARQSKLLTKVHDGVAQDGQLAHTSHRISHFSVLSLMPTRSKKQAVDKMAKHSKLLTQMLAVGVVQGSCMGSWPTPHTGCCVPACTRSCSCYAPTWQSRLLTQVHVAVAQDGQLNHTSHRMSHSNVLLLMQPFCAYQEPNTGSR